MSFLWKFDVVSHYNNLSAFARSHFGVKLQNHIANDERFIENCQLKVTAETIMTMLDTALGLKIKSRVFSVFAVTLILKFYLLDRI